MIKLLRCDSGHKDFIYLVSLLDNELAVIDGKDHSFYAAFNKIDHIRYAIVVYDNERPVGCGAIKAFYPDTMEIKRMFVSTGYRNKGLGRMIVSELEKWAKELSYSKCILETGKRQPDAIALYRKCGYNSIPNYGQYKDVENSVCFEKHL